MYWLAEGIRIEDSPAGSFLLASRPLRLVRLNPALVKLLQRMEDGGIIPHSAAESKVLESLVHRGFVERSRPTLADLTHLPTVSIIIPVKDRAAELRTCLTSLVKLNYPQEFLEIVVVDDGSRDETPEVARELGAVLIQSGAVGGGPALARNKGAAVASGEILAFIDSDCSAAEDWLAELLPAFADKKLAAVGGWVDGMHQGTSLDRYEAVMSSLNLGQRELSGGAGGDTFYLPSCNLLMRKEAFAAAGGFRAELQVGEDVDLTWRLRDAGWSIRYLPCGTVYHAHRSQLRSFMKRRFEYGTSEGMLQRLHPVRGKKMLLPPMLAAILLLLLVALGGLSLLPLPLAGLLLILDTGLTKRKMTQQGPPLTSRRILTARVRAVGSLGYFLGYHLLRYYLLPLLLATLIHPPFILVVFFILLGVATVDHQVRRARLSLPCFWVYYFLEQLAYGSGVFWGCLKVKSFVSYRLDLKGA